MYNKVSVFDAVAPVIFDSSLALIEPFSVALM